MVTTEELDALAAGNARAWLHFDETSRPEFWHLRRSRKLPARLTRAELAEVAGNANGFLRERAVARLRESADPEALPLLVIRSADWVAQVREPARRAVLARLTRADLVPLLPLTIALSRRHGDGWLDEHLVNPVVGSAELLDAALSLDDFRTRRLVLDAAAGVLSDERLARLAVADSDSVVRTRAGTLVLDHGDPALARTMLRAGAPRVRARALQLLGATPEHLDDASSFVRSMAQALLAGSDPASHYREVLARGVVTPATVAGLGETGTAADADVLASYFTHTRPRVRAVAVRGLRRLLSDPADPRAAKLARPMLADSSPAVVRAAAVVLEGRLTRADHPVLLDLTGTQQPAHVRRAAARLVRGLGTWWRLELDLRLLTAPADPLAEAAGRDFGEWLRDPTTTFTRPDSELAARIEERLTTAEPELGPEVVSRVRKLLRTATRPPR